MVFEKKKIQTETLGEYLIEVRQNLNLSHDDVAAKTNISIKFLESLESGRFKILPADVYVLGFLKQLATLYSVSCEELVGQYKKEKGIERKIQTQSELEKSEWYKRIFGKIVITPKFLTLLFSLLFIFGTTAYIIWQVWSINKTPPLEIFSPHNNDIVKEAFVEVKGKTDPGILVAVNNQSVFVDGNGNFHNQIGLSQGPSQITISATNRFGKVVTKSITLSGSGVVTETEKLILKLDFTEAVTIGYVIDSLEQQTISFSAGDSKTFMASQKITIDTSNAGATKLTLNGQSLGAMGKLKEPLNGVAFYPQHNLEEGVGN
jgi:transcriptional regulator with XRE-family HTH domain